MSRSIDIDISREFRNYTTEYSSRVTRPRTPPSGIHLILDACRDYRLGQSLMEYLQVAYRGVYSFVLGGELSKLDEEKHRNVKVCIYWRGVKTGSIPVFYVSDLETTAIALDRILTSLNSTLTCQTRAYLS